MKLAIPKLQANGELPKGEHLASLNEVEVVYGTFSERRKILMKGLRNASSNLEAAGVKIIWLDGSFVTHKKDPNDIDGCWEYNSSVDVQILDPVFLGSRAEMKKKYGLDFFIANIVELQSGLPFPQFFQKNREGDSKRIIFVKLGESS